jgi:hypothetical protein
MHEPLQARGRRNRRAGRYQSHHPAATTCVPWQLVAAGHGYDQAEQVRELLRRQGFLHTGAATWQASSAVPEVGNGQHDEQS